MLGSGVLSTYLFNNKRDQETNKLMGVVIFLILSLVITIVVSVSVFLVYFGDYMDVQRQCVILEEKLQKMSIENYEKVSDYTRINVELNQVKNEINKLNLEKEVSGKNIKLVEEFIDAVNKGDKAQSDKFLDPNVIGEDVIDKDQKFPDDMFSVDFVLNDNLESGKVTYFHTNKNSGTDRYVFEMVLRDNSWLISDLEIFNNGYEQKAFLN